MIRQYRFLLTPGAARECGYRLYAALLELLPPELGAAFHENVITPISQYAAPQPDGTLLWVVSLFGEDIIRAAAPVLDSIEVFPLSRGALTVCSRQCIQIDSVEALLAQAEQLGEQCCLHFLTPTAFKSHGRTICLPDLRLIMQNLVKQWNACFPQCPIEDTDGEGIAALTAGLECTGLRLTSEAYRLKGSGVVGFLGRLWLRNRLSGFHRTLANALLLFGSFCGIGIKTTLGMGGCDIRWSE